MDDAQEKPVIRKKQMEVFSQAAVKDFEDRMVVHLKETFLDQTKDMAEPDLRAMIHVGINKAAGYDVIMEEDVQRYLECMVAFTCDFDTNPKTVWAGDILRTENIDGSTKMDRINEYELFVLKGTEE